MMMMPQVNNNPTTTLANSSDKPSHVSSATVMESTSLGDDVDQRDYCDKEFLYANLSFFDDIPKGGIIVMPRKMRPVPSTFSSTKEAANKSDGNKKRKLSSIYDEEHCNPLRSSASDTLSCDGEENVNPDQHSRLDHHQQRQRHGYSKSPVPCLSHDHCHHQQQDNCPSSLLHRDGRSKHGKTKPPQLLGLDDDVSSSNTAKNGPRSGGLFHPEETRSSTDNHHAEPLQGQNILLQRQRRQRQRNLSLFLELLEHCSSCDASSSSSNNSCCCSSLNCAQLKQYLHHYHHQAAPVCGSRHQREHDCEICPRVWTLLRIHAQQCEKAKFMHDNKKDSCCQVPQCAVIRNEMRREYQQQQAMDERRRVAMNRRMKLFIGSDDGDGSDSIRDKDDDSKKKNI